MLKIWTTQVGKLQARKDESLNWVVSARAQEEP